MRIDLGAKVRTSEGKSAGHVKQAIWDPRNNEITGYVVSTGGLLGHDVIVSGEMLGSAARDGDEIALDIDKRDLDELARFEPSAYTEPPTDWLAPAAYGFPAGGYLWPVTDVDGGTVQEPPQENIDQPGHLPNLRRGMKVRDAGGDVIGDIEEVRIDEATGELRALLVRSEGEIVEIDPAHIERVDEDVRLGFGRRELPGRQRA